MDFHEMKRKELQALCKKHGVPANLTNCEMADRLHRILQNPESGPQPQEPISLPSCLVASNEGNDGNSADSMRKRPKKVRFSPENETFIFEASVHKAVGRTRGRRKPYIPRKVDGGQRKISGNNEGLKTAKKNLSVQQTRSRAAMVLESDDVNADLPIAAKKRGHPKKEKKSTENDNVETDEALGGLVRRQLRSRQLIVPEGNNLVAENAHKRPRKSATQESQPTNQNLEVKGVTTGSRRKCVVSKNEEASNSKGVGVAETEMAPMAVGPRGPLTRRGQTLMVTSCGAATAELGIQENAVEVKKGREAVIDSSSNSVVDFVKDETHVGKQNKELKKKRKGVTGTGTGHVYDKVVRRFSRNASVNISDTEIGPVPEASENQKESDEYRMREIENEAPGKSCNKQVRRSARNASGSSSDVSVDPVIKVSEKDRGSQAVDFSLKSSNNMQVRRSARNASVSSSDVSVDPMIKASEKERASRAVGFSGKSSDNVQVRRAGRNASAETPEANRRTEWRMARIEEEGAKVGVDGVEIAQKDDSPGGPLTRHRRTLMVTSNGPTVAELKDGISVVEQNKKLKKKRKGARGTRRGTVYEKAGRSSHLVAPASTVDVPMVPTAEASESDCRLAKIEEEALGSESLLLPEKVSEGNFTSVAFGSAIATRSTGTKSSNGVLEFSDGSHDNKQVRRSARIATVSSSDALISPVKRASVKKEENEFRIACTGKETPAIESPSLLGRTTNSSNAALELSDKGYCNKQVRSSARIASLSSSSALISKTNRASGKERGSESRIGSIEEKIPDTESLLLPKKTTESTSGALEFSDRGCSDKQVSRFAGIASVTSSDASIGPATRASGKKRGSESRITNKEEEAPGIESPTLPEKISDSGNGALELSDKGYSNKQIRISARIASVTSSDASISPMTRASGKKRENKSRITSIEEEILGIGSPLPEKISDSSNGASEFSDKGYSSKQVMRSARVPSVTSSADASVGPLIRASGKRRESESRITSIKEETPVIESPLLEKITDSINRALESSDKGYSSKQFRRSARVASVTSSDASIGLMKSASGEKRESESRKTGIEEETSVIESLSLPVKVTDSSSEVLEFSDKGYSNKQARRSARLASASSLDASIGPMTKASGKKRENKSRIASKEEDTPGNGSLSLLKKMTESEVELVTSNCGTPAEHLDSTSSSGTSDFSRKSSNSRRVRKSVHNTSPSTVRTSVSPITEALEANKKGGCKMESIEEEDPGSGALNISSKRYNNKRVRDFGSVTFPSSFHAVSPLRIEALKASRGSERRMASIEEEAQCSGSLSSPEKTTKKQVELAAPDSAMIAKNLGSNSSDGAFNFSGRGVYNMTEGLMTGYDTHEQLKIAETENDSPNAESLGTSGGNAFISTSDTAAGAMAFENKRESKDVMAVMEEEIQCTEATGTVHIEIVCQADGFSSVQTESSGLHLETPSGDENMNSKCNQMSSNDGTTSLQGGPQVIMEAINTIDSKPMDEITREDSINEASGCSASRMDLKERTLLSASCTEIACSKNNDDKLAGPSEPVPESQDAMEVTESAIDNEARLGQIKQADIEENGINKALECPFSQSLSSEGIFHEGGEGENLLDGTHFPYDSNLHPKK